MSADFWLRCAGVSRGLRNAVAQGEAGEENRDIALCVDTVKCHLLQLLHGSKSQCTFRSMLLQMTGT